MTFWLCAACHIGFVVPERPIEIITLESISVYDLWLEEQEDDEDDEYQWGPYIDPDYYPLDDF